MENGHELRIRSDDDEELEDEASPSEIEEQPPRSESPVVMPCTSTTDAAGRTPVYTGPPPIQDSSSDEVDCTDDGDEVDDGEEGDDDDSSDESQLRDLTVTYKSEETNEEIPTATLIRKRQDPVDKFLPFVAAILRSIQNEQFKMKLMEDISQVLINAKTEEIKRFRHPRLQ